MRFLMEGQVRMMLETYDALHGGASVTTLEWLDTDMGMALTFQQLFPPPLFH